MAKNETQWLHIYGAENPGVRGWKNLVYLGFWGPGFGFCNVHVTVYLYETWVTDCVQYIIMFCYSDF